MVSLLGCFALFLGMQGQLLLTKWFKVVEGGSKDENSAETLFELERIREAKEKERAEREERERREAEKRAERERRREEKRVAREARA